MKINHLFLASASVLIAITSVAQNKPVVKKAVVAAKPSAVPVPVKPLELKTQKDSVSYALGVEIAKNLIGQNLGDIEFKLLNLTRTRLHHFLKGRHKAEGTKAILGIDLTGYKEYLENQFTEGMSWENFGEWEIDHIIPVSKGGSFYYTNTQPLWMKENRQKSNK